MTLPRGIAPGEYYHLFGRAAHRQPIFKDKYDWQRFLFGILYLQSPLSFPQIGRLSRTFSEEGFPVPTETVGSILRERLVELTAFAIMPNHFHLIVKENEEGGIARYMQRVLLAYTKYFNTRYGGSGHVFQGNYRAVHVADNRQLLYLSAYIHRNPRELKGWKDKESTYLWSSLQDYVAGNRWGGLLATDVIAGQFETTSRSNYADFVRTSGAKTLKEELGELYQ